MKSSAQGKSGALDAAPPALLCMGCGYDLGGLASGDACPECGRSVRSSLASGRAGTPVQGPPTVRGLAGTVLLVWRRPVRVWDRVRVDMGLASQLELPVVFVATAAAAAAAGAAVWSTTKGGAGQLAFWIIVLMVFAWPPTFLMLLLLNLVERRGVRLWGKAHGSRVTPDVARWVTAHASAGWLGGALVTLAAVLACTAASTAWGPLGWIDPTAVLIGGATVALLWFETLVYVGVRRLRFVNVAASEAHLADSATDDGPAPRSGGGGDRACGSGGPGGQHIE